MIKKYDFLLLTNSNIFSSRHTLLFKNFHGKKFRGVKLHVILGKFTFPPHEIKRFSKCLRLALVAYSQQAAQFKWLRGCWLVQIIFDTLSQNSNVLSFTKICWPARLEFISHRTRILEFTHQTPEDLNLNAGSISDHHKDLKICSLGA